MGAFYFRIHSNTLPHFYIRQIMRWRH